MNLINKLIRKKKHWKLVLAALLILCSISTFYYQYYQRFWEVIHKENGGYLEGISKGISENINRKIEDCFIFLNLISNLLKNQSVGSFNEVQTLINKQKDYLQFQELIFIDSAGLGHRKNGQTIPLSGDLYLRDTILKKEQSLSTLQTIDNKEKVLLAVPVENTILDGKNIVALAASFEVEVFKQILSMTSFDEKAYSYIVNKEGKIILGNSSPNILNMGYNPLDIIQGSQLDENSQIIKLKEDNKGNPNGNINIKVDGTYIYMTYNSAKMQDLYLLTFVAESEVNKKSDRLIKITLLIFGSAILISFVLALILVLFYRRYRLELENIAYVDPITGGNTLQGFYKMAKETITLSNEKQYALVYTNIRNFKVLNEQLGHSNCDGILKAINESISVDLRDKEVVGRVASDHFCVLLEYKDNHDLHCRFADWYAQAKQNVEKQKYAQWMHPEMEFGVYVIENNTVSLPLMLDRAKLALRDAEAIPNTRLRFALYDDRLRRELLREQQIEVIMEEALYNGEFEVYLQPKYSTTEERLIGAEALIRWKNETEGMIYPDEFIPVFEKNGFIIQLDLWIFEEVCRLLRTWLDEGKEPIKVSVNCSRIHFRKSDFVMEYVKIAKSYNIPASLIEIELTENLVLENMDRFIKIIEEIRQAGFGCSIDDFGSGYSSLSLIKDIAVDTLKLDRVFFRYSKEDQERAEFVISSIISMAKALSMKTVAEGVEDMEQVEMLKTLGCDYIQGYVFGKPMPIKDFEQLF